MLPDGTVQLVVLADFVGPIRALNRLFVKSHPAIHFKVVPADNGAVIDALTFDATGFAVIKGQYDGGQQYAHYVHGQPFGIRIAHASINGRAAVSPLAVIVNRSNPIQRLSVDQVTRIFTQGGRTTDLTEWSQVGVAGPLGRRRIRCYGLPWMDQYPCEDSTFGDYLFHRKFHGLEPAANYECVPRYADVVTRVSKDPEGIGITALNRAAPTVKLVPLSSMPWAAPLTGTSAEIQSGAYPFDRFIRVYVRIVRGKAFDPFVHEYLRMVLSRQGQATIASEAHGYLPLNATEIGEELSRLQ